MRQEPIAPREGDDARGREVQEAYRILVDRSLQGLVIVQEGRIVFANPTAADIAGSTVEELLTTSLEQTLTFVHPEDRPMARQWYEDRMGGSPAPSRYEVRALRKDGRHRWLEVHAGLIEYRGRSATQVALTDITVQKETEEALRTCEDRFGRVFEESPVGMVLTGRNFEFLQANPAFCRMLGYTPQEMNGKTFLDVTHAEHRGTDRENVEKLWRGQISCYKTEKRYLAKNGDIRWGSLSASLLRNRKGEPLHALAIVEDITARKRSQTLLEIQRDLAIDLNGVDDLRGGLHVSLQGAIRASGLDCGGVYLRDETSGAMDLGCHIGLSEAFVRGVSHYEREAANVQLTMRGDPIYANYVQLGIPLTDVDGQEGLGAIAIVPILHGKQVIGCLNVASHTLPEVPAYARTALETIASQIGGTFARLEAEEEVRRERELRDRIADTSPAGIAVADREGRLKFANPRAEEILGLTREQITQRTYNAPDWRITDYDGGPFPEEQLPFRQVITTGQPVHNVRHAIEWPDGRRVLLSLNAAPILDDAGQIEGMVATIDDVTEQVRVERALQESEKHMRLMVEASPWPLHVTRPATGEVLLVNPATCELFGYDRQEILHKSPRDFYANPERDRPGVLAELQERGRVVQRELALRKSDGTVFPAVVSLEPIEYERRPATLVVIYDLTERKKAEEVIKKERDFSELVINALPGIFYIFDENGKFLRWNKNLETVTGYSAQEIAQQTAFDHVREDDRELMAQRMGEVFSQGRGDVEVVFASKAGKETPYYCQGLHTVLNGKPYLIGVGIDITERKRAEDALRESEELFSAVVGQAKNGIILIQDKRLIFANQALADMSGYSREELSGRPFIDFVAPESREPVGKRVERRLRGENVPSTYEAKILRRDGQAVDVELVATVIQHRGIPTDVGIIRDITERKQAEEALRLSEQKLRDILNGSPVPLFVIDKDHTIIHWNMALERYSNLTSQEMIGTKQHGRAFYQEKRPCMADILVEGDTRSIPQWYGGKFKKSELVEGAYQATDFFPHLHKGGRWLEFTAVAIKDVAGNTIGALEMLEDITERKKAEEALQQSEEKFSKVFRASPALIGISRLSDGRFLDVNESLVQATGYRREELIGRTSLELGLWADPKDRERLVQRIAAERSVRDRQVRFRVRDGRILLTRYSAEMVEIGGETCLLSVFVDVTEWKRAEDALRVSEERFRRVFEEGPVGMVLTSRDFGFFHANPAFCRMLGYEEREMNGMTFLDVTHPEHRDTDRENVERLWQGEIPCYKTEKRYLAKNGDIRWGSLTASLIQGREGKPLYALAIVEDVTERKRAEYEVRTHRQQLRSLASELVLAEERERRHLAENLHDHVCQDLVLARMNLQSLLAGPSSDEAATVQELDTALGDVIENIRDLTVDLSSPTLYKFGLEAALEELLDDMMRGKHGLECHFHNDAQAKPLADDVRVLLFRSVRELLVNVLKHAQARHVTLDIRHSNGFIEITVTDDGVGCDVREVFSPAAHHRHFGLLSVRERLDYVGGRLEIRSQPGQGSRFRLLAPLDAKAGEAGRNRDGSQNSAGG